MGWDACDREYWGDLHDIYLWVTAKHGPPGGGFAGRYGDMAYNVGTVPEHAHFTHYLPHTPGEGMVLVPFGKDAVKLNTDILTMLEHKKKFDDGHI